jgi:glutathione synthase
MLALTLKKMGFEVYLLFEKNLYFTNKVVEKLCLFEFTGNFREGSYYIEKFSVGDSKNLILNEGDILHMRIDPPFDTRYLRYLWILGVFERRGIKVFNSSKGILNFNEKLTAYELDQSHASFIGIDNNGFVEFIEKMQREGVKDFIFKPLDLYQGLGIDKISFKDINQMKDVFNRKVNNLKGPIVVQPFDETITRGEIRSLFVKGRELGSILKVPPKNKFLANIAQGASYSKCLLSEDTRTICEKLTKKLMEEGIYFVAFDIIGNCISEVNITCPGLVVEVSEACRKNLAEEMVNDLWV